MLDQQKRCKDSRIKAAVMQRHEDMTRDDKEGIFIIIC